MAEGEFALVRHYLEIAIGKTAAWVGEHDLYAMLADAAAQQCDVAALQHYAPLAAELAARYDHKLYQAIAHRAQGVEHRLAGRTDEAENRLQQALELFQPLAAHWQIGRTLFELGECALSRAENARAHEHFRRALAAFEKLGAAPDAARTREKLADF